MKLLDDISAIGKLPGIGKPAALPTRYEHLTDIIERNANLAPLASPKLKKLLDVVFGNSPYLSNCIFKEAEFFLHMCEQGADVAAETLFTNLRNELPNCASQEQLMSLLRRAKMRCSLLTAVADISHLWGLDQVTGVLSRFAEESTEAAIDYMLKKAHEKGELSSPRKEDSGLIVLAMGKLGARALNYSSDIDLILFFNPEKTPYTGGVTAQLFFNKLAQELTRILEDRTADGYVFRVDLRLRPDPASTPPVVSVPAAENYYETVGQNWERAALIKARAIAGDREAARIFLEWLSPFIWRRYLDYASIQDIHSIKRQIESKAGNTLPQSLLGYNVKLGHGGIREVEFFAVTQQLIWGGKQPKLRSIRTGETLQNLTDAGKMKQSACDELIEAYGFYRTVEHRLQMVEDAQTHSLPTDPAEMEAFAKFMGFESPQAFDRALSTRLRLVQRHYSQLFHGAPSLANPIEGGSLVFTGTNNDPETVKTMQRMGFENGENISEIIRGWHHGRRSATRTKRARELITELTPAMLAAFSGTPYPDQAFARFDEFLSKLPSSIQIFSLFYAKPELLDVIAEIMGGYPYIAENLSRKPELLDYLLSTDFYLSLPPKEILITQLQDEIGATSNLEDVLNHVRRFTHDRQFRIGIQLIKNKILIQDVGKVLSDVADAVLTVLQDRILAEFKEKHGSFEGGNFAILAFGKLGSRELTFGSDLDLVFIYDVKESDNHTADLTVNEYFARVGRRIITGITAMTREGTLYEIDTRLRPSGKDGPVASSFSSFSKYYDEGAAWTWETMALTRARVITGSASFRHKIKQFVLATLAKPRELPQLKKHVSDMRERIEKEHPGKSPLDIKYVPGGMIDLEFLAQYLQLGYSNKHPQILKKRVDEVLAACIKLGIADASQLQDCLVAYELYRHLQFFTRVIGITDLRDENLSPNLKATLEHMLSRNQQQPLPFEEVQKMLVKMQKGVREYFLKIITI